MQVHETLTDRGGGTLLEFHESDPEEGMGIECAFCKFRIL
jgi:hypothetical protein